MGGCDGWGRRNGGGKVEATVLEQQIKKCEKGSYYFTFAIIVELEEICRI